MTPEVPGAFRPRVALAVPDAIGAARAAAARAELARAGYAPYRLLDRGRYEVCEVVTAVATDEARALPAAAEVLAAAARAAGELAGRPLEIAAARALRLGPGDYVLAHHDAWEAGVLARVGPARAAGAVEVALELSRASAPGAELCYRDRGRLLLQVPAVPGALAVVEHRPALTRHHGYVSRRAAAGAGSGVEIVRVVALLTPPAGAPPAPPARDPR